MKNGEYILTEDTGAVLNELYGGVDEQSNSLYLGRLATILSESTIDSTVRVFEESEIDRSISDKMVATLDSEPYDMCVILDRFLGRSVEKNPTYADRVSRFSITRGLDGEKMPRLGQPGLDEQISDLAEMYKNKYVNQIYLVDDGLFTGGTVDEVRKRLGAIGFDIRGVIGYLQSNEATIDSIDVNGIVSIPQLDEWVDIRDFSMFGGKINNKGQSGRAGTTVPYIAPWSNGESASLDMLPDFFDVSDKILTAQIDLLRSYEERFGPLTVRDMVKTGFAVPTNIEKSIPITINTNVVDYLQMCRNIVENEQRRFVAILDMDGTLYDLVSDGATGYNSSLLKQRVEANALDYISDIPTVLDAEQVLNMALKDTVGISAYLEERYGIARSQYFDAVWDINPEGIVKRDEELIQALIGAGSGNIGSEKVKLVLLTAAPCVWAKNVLRYLGLENVFEAVYSGESYGQKQEVMRILAKRYNPNNMVSVGDQVATDILPAEELGISGRLVTSTKDTIKVIKEILS